MSEEQARERLREYIRQHFSSINRAALGFYVSNAHLAHMLSGRKRINDRILKLIGLRRVETLEPLN